MELMNVLLSRKISVDEKMRILEEKFNISTESKIEKELNLMCNLSDLVVEEAMEQGIEQGIKQERMAIAEKMFRKGWMVGEIADMLEESIEAIQVIVQRLKEGGV